MPEARVTTERTPAATLSFPASQPTAQSITRHTKLGGRSPDGHTIGLTSYYLELDGRPAIPVMGEFHYSRYPHSYWDEEVRKVAAGGIDILSTYTFWIDHEDEEGRFDWSGDLNLRSFVHLCANYGLQVIVRVGPFAHGECRNGGLPDWLYGRPFAVRSTDERFLAYVQRFYAQIARQLEGLLFKDGGPVIGVQLDNEYMHAGAPWETTYTRGSEWVPAGTEGVSYLCALKKLALSVGLDVPLYTCTGWLGSPVPEDEMLPLQGGYAFTPWVPDPDYVQPPTENFLFLNRHRNPVAGGAPTYTATRYPYACCELGGGIQITYQHRPRVPAACVEAMAVVALGSGANLLGYYMYHGGSQHVGRRGYTNEHSVPRISYDFQAPVREFGQLHFSYHALKLLHLFLHAFGAQLARMGVVLPEVLPAGPEDTETLRVAARSNGTHGFVFLTNYQDHVEMPDRQHLALHIETTQETLRVPPAGTMTLRKDLSAILPINLMLGSLRLISATAQPLTLLKSGVDPTYVFFALPDCAVHYELDGGTLVHLDAPHCTVSEAGSRVIIAASPGSDSPISLTGADGTAVRILTLTREQALHSWVVPLAGQSRLLISEASVQVVEGRLQLASHRSPHFELTVYPALPGGLETTYGTASATDQGAFSRHTFTSPHLSAELGVTELGEDRFALHLPLDVLDRAAEVFLRISYTGDIGEAYLDGILVADNFCNGDPWEIGLKRFADRLATQDLVLKIVPLPSDGARYRTTGMAAIRQESQAAAISLSVETLVEYRVLVWAAER